MYWYYLRNDSSNLQWGTVSINNWALFLCQSFFFIFAQPMRLKCFSFFQNRNICRLLILSNKCYLKWPFFTETGKIWKCYKSEIQIVGFFFTLNEINLKLYWDLLTDNSFSHIFRLLLLFCNMPYMHSDKNMETNVQSFR